MKSANDSQMALGLVCREGEVLEPSECTMLDDPTTKTNRALAAQFAAEKRMACDLAALEGDPDGVSRPTPYVGRSLDIDEDNLIEKIDEKLGDREPEPAPQCAAASEDDEEPEDGEVPTVKKASSDGSEYHWVDDRPGVYAIFRAGKIRLAPKLRRRKADGLVFARDLAEEGLELLRALPATHTVPDRMPARAKVFGARRAVEVVYAAQFRCRQQTLDMYERAIEELDAGNIVGATAYVQVCLHLVLNRLATVAKSAAKKTAKKRTGRTKRTRRQTKSTRARKPRSSVA